MRVTQSTSLPAAGCAVMMAVPRSSSPVHAGEPRMKPPCPVRPSPPSAACWRSPRPGARRLGRALRRRAPQGLHRRQRPRLAGARRGRLRPGQLRPRDLDLEGRRRPLHRPAGRRDPDQEAGDQLRAGRRSGGTSQSGGNSGIFVWAPRRRSRASSPARCRAGGSRSRSSTTATPSSTRSSTARRPTGSPPTATSSRSALRR